MIPKIIHHIWIGNDPLPTKHKEYLTKWKTLYPDYKFIFWDNARVENSNILCANLKKYYYDDKLKSAMKADLLRFKILQVFGGIYSDTDNEPLKKMPDSFLEYNFFSGFTKSNVNVALMGSIIDDILVKTYNEEVFLNISKNQKCLSQVHVVTGPVYFSRLCKPFLNDSKYKFFEPIYFYPYLWTEHKKENFSDQTYSVHRWEKSWVK